MDATPTTIYLHSGKRSGANGQSADYVGSFSSGVTLIEGSYYAPTIFLHCDDVASLRGLAAICTKAADALEAAAGEPVSEAAP